MFWMLVFLQSTSAELSSSESFKLTLNNYRTCVRTTAIEFEKARESVAGTVDAAFAACDEKRAEHLLVIYEIQQKAGKAEPSMSRADESTRELIDAHLRNELLAYLFRIRALRTR